jgi:hypothetical protein
MITPEEIVGEERAAWYRLKPQERWRESPFFDPSTSSASITHGRSGMRILRRSRV